MVESLTISELAQRCQVERERYRRTRQADETYCLELFRRALTEHDQAAWETLHRQYEGVVTHWVVRYSRFAETGEEAVFWSATTIITHRIAS